MVKHSAPQVMKISARQRFGQHQLAAAGLLLIFLAQCLWLVHLDAFTPSELARIDRGLAQWRHGQVNIQDPYRSPLYYLISSAPMLHSSVAANPFTPAAPLLLGRVPWLIFGCLLGASLWYVARRLYGNIAGYMALLLYCFSPSMIQQSAGYHVQPEIGAAWGTFGAIFTAIAVAHTLYAPRRVLWNWRRILLLGLSLALAVGSQFSLWVVLPLALALMVYLAPGRRVATLAIFAVSSATAFVILWGAYSFHLTAFAAGLRQAYLLDITPLALRMPLTYAQVVAVLDRSNPALLVLLPLSLITFLVWRRTHYFGNTAPLIVAAILICLGMLTPHQPGLSFELVAMPILFVFVSGVLADLLETRYRPWILALVFGLLIGNAVWGISALARTPN